MSGAKQRARQVILAYNLLLGPILALYLVVTGSPLLAIPTIVIGHAVWMYSTLVPNCEWFGEVATRVHDLDPTAAHDAVWLTIDDGPHPDDTPRILDLLDEFEAQATFFVIGDRAEAHPALLHEIVARGHRLGNHTMSHPHFRFWAYGPRALRREVRACRKLLEAESNQPVNIFRAPAGLKNPFLQQILDQERIHLIAWSARGLDGVSTNRDAILTRIRAAAEPGGIVLVHEGRADQDGKRLAPDILRGTLEHLKSLKLRCVSPS